jgi:hypothetical protein
VLQLEQVVLIALEHNPGLAELQAQAEAMATLPSQVDALPDPVSSLNATLPAAVCRSAACGYEHHQSDRHAAS